MMSNRSPSPEQPNIIFILLDDLGWRDLGFMGSTFYETPNIDALAARSLQFSDAYAACPVCSPTRASLLTGKYPARLGITDWIDANGSTHPCRGKLIDVPYLKQLPTSEVSLATALAAGGYQTWHIGKWHLGGEGFGPEEHGFAVNIGGCHVGAPFPGGYFSPWTIPALQDVEVPAGTYLTDYLTDQAMRLIKHRSDAPFFLNLWYYTVHTPIEAKRELIEKYRQKAADLGLDKMDPFADGGPFPTQHKAHLRLKRRRLQSDPVYAAMIETLDDNIGRLWQTLVEEGLDKETILIFTSDNGGLATAEGSPTCNAPLAEGKGWMYEGGTREPLFVRWPGVTRPGTLCATPVTSPDFYPTLLTMAGLEHRPEQHSDGTDLTPLLKGDDLSERPLFWHYPHYGNQGGTPGAAVRLGDWKLIRFFEDDRLELYNLADDIGEANNLALPQPGKRDELARLLSNWQASVEALFPERNKDLTG